MHPGRGGELLIREKGRGSAFKKKRKKEFRWLLFYAKGHTLISAEGTSMLRSEALETPHYVSKVEAVEPQRVRPGICELR